MKTYGIFLLLSAVTLFCQSIALCDTVYFRSENELSNWTMYYYLNPEPEKVPIALEYYSDSSLYEKFNTRDPMAAFFAVLFKNNIQLMEKTYEKLCVNSSENSKIIFLNALWFADTAESRELIKKANLQWKSGDIQQVIKEMNYDLPGDILVDSISSAVHLDMLWWTFFATGNSEPIKKIISVVHLEKEGHGMEIVIGGAAVWSLTSNAYQHQKVYDVCKEELKNSRGQTKKILEEIIKKVDQRKAEEQSGKP